MPVALLLLLAAPQTWSYDVGPAPLVKASIVGGTIRVEAIQARGVGIRAEASGGTDDEQARWNVETRGSQSQVSLHICCGACGKRGKGQKCSDAVHFDLALRVPADARLELNGISSRVSVAGVAGKQSITTIAGDIEIEGSAGALRLSTVSGKISVRPRQPAAASIHSVSGDIALTLPDGAQARVTVSTVRGRLNGNPKLRSVGRSGPKIAVETASGNVTVVDSARPSR
jgi:putative adhesin